MEKTMVERMPEIVLELRLEHDMYTITKIEND